ncbi:MAG: DUF4160 domain-containing protein [Alphaproteobacteria bacterium]|nr:DUF4160 domain-containing protein [Alphaproteobacteria bacterium]
MPTVLRDGGCRFYFYSHEPGEPAHVHVDKGAGSVKIWLRPVSVARNVGLSAHQIAEIVRMVVDRQALLLEAWDGFFNTKG